VENCDARVDGANARASALFAWYGFNIAHSTADGKAGVDARGVRESRSRHERRGGRYVIRAMALEVNSRAFEDQHRPCLLERHGRGGAKSKVLAVEIVRRERMEKVSKGLLSTRDLLP
jgi:hypothetical protein